MLHWARHSLTVRIIALIMLAQASMIAFTYFYQERDLQLYEPSELTLEQVVPTLKYVYTEANSDGILLAQYDWRQEVFLDDIIQKNKRFWFRIETSKEEYLSGSIPSELLATRLSKIQTDDQMVCQERTTVRNKGNIQFVENLDTCSNKEMVRITAGGLEPGFIPKAIYYPSTLSDYIYLQPLLVMLTLVFLATPVLVYLTARPLLRASERAKKLSPHDIEYRIPEEEVASEVRGFVASINAALNRLQEGYLRERRFRDAMAHELRTPLTILRGRLEEVAKGALKDKLIGDVGRMQRIITRLLEFSRAMAYDEKNSEYDASKVARAACADIANYALDCNFDIELKDNTQGNSWNVRSQTALRLIIHNLVTNAIEHSHGKLVRVTIEPNNMILVEDDGTGLPELVSSGLGTPYKPTNGMEAGSNFGLGLSIVVEIIRFLDAKIRYSRSDLGGSQFLLRFADKKT